MKKRKIILGIDPGIARLGYGIIEIKNKKIKVIKYGCLETSKEKKQSIRLFQIYSDLKKIIKKYDPDWVALEKLFFAKNVKTAVRVGQAAGMVLLLLGELKKKFEEYTPLQVKITLTGYGKASKIQMQRMLKRLLGLKEIPRPDDAADGLALAICLALYKKWI